MGDDSLTGGSGADIFKVASGSDTIVDLTSDDDLVVTGGTATANNVSLFVADNGTKNAGGTAIINSDSSGSTITLTNALSGNFDLRGSTDVDIITGGSGDDIITGSDGDDVLSGGDGADSLDGGNNDDSLTGGNGDDTFTVGAGSDTITDLQTGDDLVVTGGTATATVSGNFVADSDTSNAGTAIINADTAGSTITMTDSTSGAYDLRGGNNADIITGGSGDDIITGGGSGDTLSGGDGADDINGGDGDDNLTGGAGTDTFRVDAGSDTITDLGTGGVDDLIVTGGSVTAIDIVSWTADSDTTVTGSVELKAKSTGGAIDVSNATGSSAFTLTGGTGTDLLQETVETISLKFYLLVKETLIHSWVELEMILFNCLQDLTLCQQMGISLQLK